MPALWKKLQTPNLQDQLKKEWLLSNKRGGFSCSTLACCNTRRYHGLLTGSLNPPATRIKGLAALVETLIVDSKEIELSNFEFKDQPIADSAIIPINFTQDIGTHFEYEFDFADLKKSIYLDCYTDRVAIVYDFSNLTRQFSIKLRPLVSINNFHALLKSNVQFCQHITDSELNISSDTGGKTELRMYGDKMMYTRDENWWHNFNYRLEQQRGQDHLEDLWSPGYYDYKIEQPEKIVFWASLSDSPLPERLSDLEVDILCDNLLIEQKNFLKNTPRNDINFQDLCIAADKFIVNRTINGKETATILAGFPWFLDWGRDTFISLKGLLLDTGRFEQARQVLCTFASAVDQGMVPNRFDDYNNEPHYNSIDASLWFINSAFEYLKITGDRKTFTTDLLPVIQWIIEAYSKGTRFQIHADDDGLITGGSLETQLTWMDAKCGDVTFTPRYGKAVEINALWYNAICNMAQYYQTKDSQKAQQYSSIADKVEQSFENVFWNETESCLFDCIFNDGHKDPAIRPNQIFAVSLDHSPLSVQQQKAVVEKVQKHLLTPCGLRTLSPNDPNYIGRFEGDMFHRDQAYHQGTVWPWLMGPFIKAYLKVNNYSYQSKSRALEFIRPLTDHFDNSGCINNISEVFDGNPPHQPKGCFAQAWSVAQLIEAFRLITE